MEMFLAACLIGFLITKVVTTHRIEHEYAKRGAVPPRIQVKLDRLAAAGGGTVPAGPGARGYLRELWLDAWEDLTERHRRVRVAKKTGEHSTLEQRARSLWHWARRPLGDKPHHDSGESLATPAPVRPAPPMQSTGDPDQTAPASPAGDAPAPLGTSAPAQVDQPAQPTPGGRPMSSAIPTQAATPTGEATDIRTAVSQAQALRLASVAAKEQLLADLSRLERAIETLDASASEMEVPQPVQGQIDRAQEAMAALRAAVAGTAEEVAGAMQAVETEFAKHLPVDDMAAGLGGLAKKQAYTHA